MITLMLLAVDQAPEEEDVVAGWLAFGIFLGLAAATALLLWSFTRQLKRAKAANDAGVLPSAKPDSDNPAWPPPEATPTRRAD
ncbi:hypothetical protein BH09ACT11_BH09ACT11_02340 [soil metagenome]